MSVPSLYEAKQDGELFFLAISKQGKKKTVKKNEKNKNRWEVAKNTIQELDDKEIHQHYNFTTTIYSGIRHQSIQELDSYFWTPSSIFFFFQNFQKIFILKRYIAKN